MDMTHVFDGWASEATVAEGSSVIENVLLCGNVSQNGYTIPESAFGSENRVKSLYENKPVFLDHFDPSKGPSVRDLAGHIEGVTFRNGKPYGRIVTTPDANGKRVLMLAKSKFPGVGMSHTARYKFADEERTEVESVEQVLSVDVVAFPATTKSFHERKQEYLVSDKSDVLSKQLDSLQKERDELKAELADVRRQLSEAQESVDDLSKQVEALGKEKEELESELDDHRARVALEARKAAVLAELKDAGLNPDDEISCSEHFMGSLLKEGDEKARKALIKDRKQLLESATEGTVLSKERKQKSDKPFDANKFLNRSDLRI